MVTISKTTEDMHLVLVFDVDDPLTWVDLTEQWCQVLRGAGYIPTKLEKFLETLE